MPNMGNIMCSRISVGIPTFGMVNFSAKRSMIELLGIDGFSPGEEPSAISFLLISHSECLHSNV